MLGTVFFVLGVWGLVELVIMFPKATLVVAFFMGAFSMSPTLKHENVARTVFLCAALILALMAGVKLIFFS